MSFVMSVGGPCFVGERRRSVCCLRLQGRHWRDQLGRWDAWQPVSHHRLCLSATAAGIAACSPCVIKRKVEGKRRLVMGGARGGASLTMTS